MMEISSLFRFADQVTTLRGDKVWAVCQEWVACPVWVACQVLGAEEDSLI